MYGAPRYVQSKSLTRSIHQKLFLVHLPITCALLCLSLTPTQTLYIWDDITNIKIYFLGSGKVLQTLNLHGLTIHNTKITCHLLFYRRFFYDGVRCVLGLQGIFVLQYCGWSLGRIGSKAGSPCRIQLSIHNTNKDEHCLNIFFNLSRAPSMYLRTITFCNITCIPLCW